MLAATAAAISCSICELKFVVAAAAAAAAAKSTSDSSFFFIRTAEEERCWYSQGWFHWGWGAAVG